MNKSLAIQLPGLNLVNPIMPASGCFGFGREFAEIQDISKLGAIIVKSTTLEPREGNVPIRVAETPSGMLNAIGLQNPGVDYVVTQELPKLAQLQRNIIVNVAGGSFTEYCDVVTKLQEVDAVKAIELNISCPNVKAGGIHFGTNPEDAYILTQEVKKRAKQPVYVKLSPNVTDIKVLAQAVELAGADGISMINTLIGMRLDKKTGKPILANQIGGLSGPAIFPLAIRMVYQVAEHVNIPIIGMGGIQSTDDVIEMMSAGAHAVAVGTANFIYPNIMFDIIKQLPQKLEDLGVQKIEELIGRAWR